MPNTRGHVRREGSAVIVGEETILEVGRPIEALHPIQVISEDGDDYTVADTGEPEMFILRQLDEDGNAQTVCLSPAMCIEVAKLIDSFVSLPPTITRFFKEPRVAHSTIFDSRS